MVQTTDEVAEEYHETRREVTTDDLAVSDVSGVKLDDGTPGRQEAFEFTYPSRGTTKTIRAVNGSATYSHTIGKGAPENGFTFFDDGDHYAVDIDTGDVYHYNGDYEFFKYADGDDVTVHFIDLPEVAPVTGAVQEGVSVDVTYRSNRSGNLKTIRLDDVTFDWEGNRVRGHHARRDRKVEAVAVFERSATTIGRREEEFGKVAKIAFPDGHRFTVDVRGLTDDDARKLMSSTAHGHLSAADAIEKAVTSKFDQFDVDIDVTHDGRIDD